MQNRSRREKFRENCIAFPLEPAASYNAIKYNTSLIEPGHELHLSAADCQCFNHGRSTNVGVEMRSISAVDHCLVSLQQIGSA